MIVERTRSFVSDAGLVIIVVVFLGFSVTAVLSIIQWATGRGLGVDHNETIVSLIGTPVIAIALIARPFALRLMDRTGERIKAKYGGV